MNNDQKQIVRETCKSHTTKGFDREFGRTCPSKLTKRELEDLYYALLDNNLELKQNINAQNEKIKQLSTRVQRLSAVQKAGLGKIDKDCCSSSKAAIREQKDIIAELKKANDKLSERNRILNIRLCSAKQFLGKNSVRCNKCCLAYATSVKNSTTSASNIGIKISTTNMGTMVSNTDLNKEPVLLKTAEVQTNQCELSNGGVCDENRCKTLMEELKQKIVVLEEELCKSRNEYSTRVGTLEQEAARLRRSQQHGGAEADHLLQRLQAADLLCEDINHQLSVEKRKVSELETRLKAADVSAQVASTIEQYLRRQNLAKHKTEWESSEQMEYRPTKLSEPDGNISHKQLKNFDDSGYMEAVMLDEKKTPVRERTVSSELRQKILELQTQLNSVKRIAAIGRDAEKCSPNFESYDLAIEEDQISMLRSINDYNNMKKEPDFNLESSKIGEMYEIKKPESYILQERREESFNDNVTEPSRGQPIQTCSTRKPNLDIPATSKGILEKSEEYYKTHKRDEKIPKNVSYENFHLHSQSKDCMKSTLTKIEEQSHLYSVGYSPSDDKHFAGNRLTKNHQDLNENVRDSNAARTNTNQDSVGAMTGETIKDDTHRDIGHQAQKSYKEHHKVGKSIHINNKKAKHETKQNAGNKKNSNMDVRETVDITSKEEKEGSASKPVANNVPNIEIVKSDSSNKILPNDELLSRGICVIPVALRDDIKVIKEEGSVSDVNLQKIEQIAACKEEVNLNASETSDNKALPPDSFEKQIDKREHKPVKELELCARHACVCTCPRAPRRELVVFRTCSGTARFKAVARAGDALRQCACMRSEDTTCPANTTNVCSQTPGPRRASSGDTYVVRASATLHRRTRSPPRTSDTDGEISALTDLPDERDETPRSVPSPGEERQTATYTETYTSTTDYITLSEGELPVHGPGRRPYSPGERKWKNSSGEMSPQRTTSLKVEEALQAIGEELARCRHLLQHQRPQRTSSKDVSSMTEAAPDGIALHKADAQPRIAHAHQHPCCFTLHIGTVVLSDQAVAYSRGRSLVLTWRFYNRSAAMARLGPGRVAHLDFTTEYQLPLTEHFLDYLKTEDMCLKICELEKPSEVFASCSLPLRDAFAHANRRADMSLALVAGTEMLSNRVVTDALDSGDEVGVLDLWCLLKIEPSLLSTLRKVVSKPPTVTITAPIAEDQSSVYHLTHDLEARMKRHSKTHKRISGMVSNETFTMRSAQDVRQAVANEIRPSNRVRARDMSDSNTIYSLLKNKHWRTSSSKILNGQKKSVTIGLERDQAQFVEEPLKDVNSIMTDLGSEEQVRNQTLDITVLWLALNDESEAVSDPDVQRLYVAYSFLGRDAAELETPVSLPKPRSYTDKCHFNFHKKFQLNQCDLTLLERMAKCRRRSSATADHKDCLTFSVVSEPPEDPLGLNTCEDIGFAYLYLGDVLSRCAGSDSYTEVLSVLDARSAAVGGVLAVRVAGLQALRRLC